MTSQTGKQIIATHILVNISRSKGDQTIKFRQLLEYNMRTISLEKSYTECGGEAFPRPFIKNHTHVKKVGRGTHQNFLLAFIDELEKQIIIKKPFEVGQ